MTVQLRLNDTLKAIDLLINNKFFMCLKNLLEFEDTCSEISRLILSILKEEFNNNVPNKTKCVFFDKDGNPIIHLAKSNNKTRISSIVITDCFKEFIKSVDCSGEWYKFDERTYVRYTPGWVAYSDGKTTDDYKFGYSEGFNQGIVGNSEWIYEIGFTDNYPNYGKDGTYDGFYDGLAIYDDNYKDEDYLNGCQNGFNDGFMLKIKTDNSSNSDDYQEGYEYGYQIGYDVASYGN